jgi:hypothetical protein
MTGVEIVSGVIAGVIIGGAYVVTTVVTRRVDRKNGSGPVTRSDLALIANQVAEANREAARNGFAAIHEHLREHTTDEQNVFQDMRVFMQAQTATQKKICATLGKVDERTLRAEIHAEMRGDKP